VILNVNSKFDLIFWNGRVPWVLTMGRFEWVAELGKNAVSDLK
jgi:hypothetical protein